MRKMVTIREIVDISPIDNADKIEVATVSGWKVVVSKGCLLYTSPSPRDKRQSRMPSSA